MFNSCSLGLNTINPLHSVASLASGQDDTNNISHPIEPGNCFSGVSATHVVTLGNHKVDWKDQSKCVTNVWAEAGKGLISHFEV